MNVEALTSIKEIKEVRSTDFRDNVGDIMYGKAFEETNKLLEEGWVLLAANVVADSIPDGISTPVSVYILGRPRTQLEHRVRFTP